jgi:hypothetical protein
MASEQWQRLNLQTIRTTFRAAMASAPDLAEEHMERAGRLLDRADSAATSDAIRVEIADLRDFIRGASDQRTG